MEERTEETRMGAAKDARGKPATLLDPHVLRLARRYDIVPRKALDGIDAQLGAGVRKSIRVMFVVSLVCSVVGMIALVDYSYQWLSGGITFSLLRRKILGMVVVWYGPIIIWFGAKRVRMQKVARVMLEHLRCPHCGYDLRLLPTDPKDGATVCPECGHAWRLTGNPTPAHDNEPTGDVGRRT